jgi:hypothetical protein
MNEFERIGLMGELLTQYKLAEYGLRSFLVNEPEYDLLVDTGDGFRSIQVKTRSRTSDHRGNVTFKTEREQDRHLGRGNHVQYRCDLFAFVYLPSEVVLFVQNTEFVSGGFNVHQFTREMSDFSARNCGLVSDLPHARGARDNIRCGKQSIFDFNVFED